MASTKRGVGRFTAENIAAIVRAIPDSDGTYQDAVLHAQQYGASLHPHTLPGWTRTGKADLQAEQNFTAYARFTQRYFATINEHSGLDSNRG